MSVYPTDIIKQLFFSFLRFLVGTFVTNGLFHEYNDKSIIIIPTLYCSNKPLKNALLEIQSCLQSFGDCRTKALLFRKY